MRGTGTCLGASVVVLGAEICGRERMDFEGDRDGTSGDLGEAGVSEPWPKWLKGSFEGDRGLPKRRKLDRTSMLGERTDSASRNAFVRPSPCDI